MSIENHSVYFAGGRSFEFATSKDDTEFKIQKIDDGSYKIELTLTIGSDEAKKGICDFEELDIQAGTNFKELKNILFLEEAYKEVAGKKVVNAITPVNATLTLSASKSGAGSSTPISLHFDVGFGKGGKTDQSGIKTDQGGIQGG